MNYVQKFIVGKMVEYGFSYDFIAEIALCTKGQINYWCKKNNTGVKQYREGKTRTSRTVKNNILYKRRKLSA